MYLKMGEREKAVEHMRAAAEAKNRDPMMLNNIAYALAENKVDLDLARKYGEAALAQLEARSAEDVENIGFGTRTTEQLAMLWDTVGWIYFRSGEIDRSENFVRAAWVLAQDPVVGEHLGEIYEKQGKAKEAEHMYELSLAVIGPPGTINLGRNSGQEALALDIAGRYQNLTGKKLTTENRGATSGNFRRVSPNSWRRREPPNLASRPAFRAQRNFRWCLRREKLNQWNM